LNTLGVRSVYSQNDVTEFARSLERDDVSFTHRPGKGNPEGFGGNLANGGKIVSDWTRKKRVKRSSPILSSLPIAASARINDA
jgi:hypothetical protein